MRHVIIVSQHCPHFAWTRPDQHIDIYDSTPPLKTFCLPPPGQPVYFGYIRDALERGCAVKVIGGAERTSLGKQGPKGFYSALFVEITRNDLRDINTDLLTGVAFAALAGLMALGVTLPLSGD